MRASLALVPTLVSAMFVAACSTTPVPAGHANPVPPDRLSASASAIPEAHGTIIVTRDSGAFGGACYLGFAIDRTFLARFDTGETATFRVSPGEHLVQVMRDPEAKGLCAATDLGATRETSIKVNETKHFRLLIDRTGFVDVQRTDP